MQYLLRGTGMRTTPNRYVLYKWQLTQPTGHLNTELSEKRELQDTFLGSSYFKRDLFIDYLVSHLIDISM